MVSFSISILYDWSGLASKGTNLTIHGILDQIERYRIRKGRFPRQLFLQLDGGTENANSAVLGWLQVLVAKRLIPEIFFTRLPTGHTHADIDALV